MVSLVEFSVEMVISKPEEATLAMVIWLLSAMVAAYKTHLFTCDADMTWMSGIHSQLVETTTVAELELDHDSVQLSVNDLELWVLS